MELPFDLRSNVLILACKNSGKTKLVKYCAYLLAKSKLISDVHVFTNTSELNFDYSFVDEGRITNGYEESKLAQLMEKQKNKIMKELQKCPKNRIKDEYKDEILTKPENNTLLIFDDILGNDKNIQHSKLFTQLITQNRHFGFTIIISLQQSKGCINPTCRNNIDSFFISRNTPESLDHIYSNVKFKEHKTRNQFIGFCNKMCCDYWFVGYDQKKDVWKRVRSDLDLIKNFVLKFGHSTAAVPTIQSK